MKKKELKKIREHDDAKLSSIIVEKVMLYKQEYVKELTERQKNTNSLGQKRREIAILKTIKREKQIANQSI